MQPRLWVAKRPSQNGRSAHVRTLRESVQDELATTVGKADRTKQLLYFPDIDGYRFRAGSGGIFLGSKDLFISELAASCYVSCRREIGDDGRAKVRSPASGPLRPVERVRAGNEAVVRVCPARAACCSSLHATCRPASCCASVASRHGCPSRHTSRTPRLPRLRSHRRRAVRPRPTTASAPPTLQRARATSAHPKEPLPSMQQT